VLPLPTIHTHSFSDLYKVDSEHYMFQEHYMFHNFDRGVYHTSSHHDKIAARLGLTDRDGAPEFQFYYLWPNMIGATRMKEGRVRAPCGSIVDRADAPDQVMRRNLASSHLRSPVS
jgi:hypothetical protein